MADKDFIVKNGLVTGANNATFGSAVTLASNGNVGIANTTPANKLVVTGSITATANVSAASVNASTGFYGTVQTATQGTIDHNSLANYVADQHVAHSGVSISAGNGLTGGGTIAATRTLSVSPGNTQLIANSTGLWANQAQFDHNTLTNYVADQHVAHSGVSISAGNGLSGGGTIAASRSLAVVANTGIVSNATGVYVSNVPTAVTFNNGGAGAASGSTFNGNSAVTISYNTIGAPSTTGTGASGTWNITANNATYLGGTISSGYALLSGAVFTGDVTTYRAAAPTTGVIFLGNSGSRYLYFDGTNYQMPTSELYVNGVQVVKNSGTWGISISGTAATATLATKSSTLAAGGGNGTAMTFTYSGQSGQPTWLWGTNDGTSALVWNPANFNVNNATTATTATTATNQSGGTVSATTGSFSGNLSFNSGYGSSAVAYGCRAWINFDATTATPTVRGSGNISSITDNGAGDYTLNFTTAMPDVNYSVVFGGRSTVASVFTVTCIDQNNAPTTSAVRIASYNASGSRLENVVQYNVAIFR